MDPRLDHQVLAERRADMARRARAARPAEWPDDGLPARTEEKEAPLPLHPTTILASLVSRPQPGR